MIDKATSESSVLFNETDEVTLKSFEKAHLNDGFGSYRDWNAGLFYPFKKYYQFSRQKYGYNPIRQNSSKGVDNELANSRMNTLIKHDSYTPNFLTDRYRNPYSNKVDFFEDMLFRYIKSVKVKINVFKIGETIVIVDQLNSEVKIYNQMGVLLKTNSLDFSGEIIEIIQDPSTGKLFFTSESNQLFKIHKLDVKTGLTSYSGGFKNISLTKSRKIYDGWIYYRVLKNGYHKLYRTRLRS